MKDKKVYIVGVIITLVLIVASVTVFLVTSNRVQRGVVVDIPVMIDSDSGKKVVIKNAYGVETTVTIGGVFARNEKCGEVIGSLKEGAKVEYRLLPGGAFCVYDGKTSLENVYIKVIP